MRLLIIEDDRDVAGYLAKAFDTRDGVFSARLSFFSVKPGGVKVPGHVDEVLAAVRSLG